MFKKANKITKKYMKVAIYGIIIATFFWLRIFNHNVEKKIVGEAEIRSEELIFDSLNTVIKKSMLKFDNDEFLIFSKNSKNELILTEYNMNSIYKFLDEFKSNLKLNHNEYIIFIPSGSFTKSFLLGNLGTKIPVKIKLSDNIFVNLKSKVVNYGINNALVEIYLVINTKEQVLIPFDKHVIKGKYELLVSTYFITGKVPNIFSENFELTSNNFDINIKI